MTTKDEILQEIRKAAKENNNIPLSESKFKEKTGIIPYEWHRYWPRWGDATQEAGFTRNTFLKIPHNPEELSEKLISLIRELNKFPTKGEMEVKHNSDPNFPDSTAFYRKFGLKRNFVSKILEYAESKGYQDVVGICNETLEEFTNELESESSSLSANGSVYLVKSGNYYKIGRTNDMDRRHQEITIILPEGLTLVHEIKTDDPSGIENYWHRRFEPKRKNGEWFDLNASDVKAFRMWRKIA